MAGLRGLDYKEGYRPTNPDKSSYIRRRRRVRLASGDSVAAWIYKANRSRTTRRLQKPTRAYVELMVSGALRHKLSFRWIDQLRQISTEDLPVQSC